MPQQLIAGGAWVHGSPYTHHDLVWGSPCVIRLMNTGVISLASNIARTTFQPLLAEVCPFPFAWVYDIQIGFKSYTAQATTNNASFEVVVGVGATPGNPFNAPTSEFASLMTSNLDLVGVNGLTGAAHAAGTYTMRSRSVRFDLPSSLIKAAADPYLYMHDRAMWHRLNLQNRTNETMFPVLRRGDHIGVRITSTGVASTQIEGLYANITLVPSDRPFDGT